MSGTVTKWLKYLISQIFGRLTFPRETLFTSGRHLYDTNGQQVVLMGVNLPLLDDWNFPGSDKLTELEQTGANAIRIEWYKSYGNPARPAYTVADLDAFLTK